MKKHIIPLILLTIVSILLLKDVITQGGFPDTHDGQNHLARMANYYLAFIQGQVPPRWAPNLEAGLGYTSLNFNYPLANIISLPFTALKISLQTTFKIIYFLAVISSGFGMYAYLLQRYSKSSSVIGAVAYMLAPYQITNLYVRGNIGETLAFAVFPWVVLVANRATKNKKMQPIFSVLLAIFLLSHNLIALLSIPMIVILLMLDNNFKQLNQLFMPAIISFFLVGFFWIPALIEKNFIIIDSSPLSITQFAHHFPRLDQLFGMAWDHGYSYTFPVDGMNFSLGILTIISLIFAIPTILAKYNQSKYELAILSLCALTIFLMTVYSLPIWQLIPQTAIIQFPWRLLFFTTIICSILVAYVAQHVSRLLPIVIIAIILLSHQTYSLGINYFQHPNVYWFTFPLNTTILNENDPRWYHRLTAHQLKDGTTGNIIAFDPSAKIQIKTWNGSHHEYSVTSASGSSIIEKTIYFPGWQTTINGQLVNINQSKDNYGGLINFEVAAGEHQIETRFTQFTPARLIGNLMTIMGIIGVLYVFKQSFILKK